MAQSVERNYPARLWPELARLVQALNHGRYWTVRRDACEDLFRLGCQAAVRLRQTAANADADVSHCARESGARLQKALEGDWQALLPSLDAELETRAGEIADESAETMKSAQSGAAPTGFADSAALLAWVETFAREKGGAYASGKSGASVTLPVPGERKQTIFVDVRGVDSQKRPVGLFYSVCGPADAQAFEWALAANAQLSRGAFGLIESRGQKVLILLLRRPIAEINPDTLGKKLVYLAEKADWAEARLKDRDTH
jgi:hypothetical protein